MQNVVKLNVVMLNAVMLNVIMLNVVAPRSGIIVKNKSLLISNKLSEGLLNKNGRWDQIEMNHVQTRC
jgi:hypothetical protein